MREPPKAARTPRSVKAQPRIPGAMLFLASGHSKSNRLKLVARQDLNVKSWNSFWQKISRLQKEVGPEKSPNQMRPHFILGLNVFQFATVTTTSGNPFSSSRSVAAAQGTDDGQQEHIHLSSLKTASHTCYRIMAPYSS